MFYRITLGAFFICTIAACTASHNLQTQPSVSNIYKNEVLAFTIEVPSGWYLPAIDDTDPHFFETKACAESYNPTCAAFEIQNLDTEFAEGPDAVFNIAASEGLHPQKHLNLISDAIVIETSPEAGAEGWYFEYHVFFSKEKRRFLIFNNDKKIEKSILSTFKVSN
jgi:hypothetical protein